MIARLIGRLCGWLFEPLIEHNGPAALAEANGMAADVLGDVIRLTAEIRAGEGPPGAGGEAMRAGEAVRALSEFEKRCHEIGKASAREKAMGVIRARLRKAEADALWDRENGPVPLRDAATKESLRIWRAVHALVRKLK